jgi:parvulin-like peptidyl-prolyl isomerase
MLSALLAGGCESWRSAKNDHPVLGPPPPRLSQDEVPAMRFAEADAEGPSDAGFVKVSLTDPEPLSDHAVVAIVNGEPIMAGELLAPVRVHYAGMSKWQAEQYKRMVIEKTLDRRIDEVLLVQALELMLKPEQLKQMNEMLDKEFQKKSEDIQAGLGVNSRAEAEKLLSKQSTSLAEYEQAFKMQQLAALYMQEKMGALTPVIGRQEILDYYETNIKKYEHPARAQFQLLLINYGNGVSQDDAKAKLHQALDALDAGEAFPNVAKRFSEGPQAARGGQWDWLKPGEFADPNVDRALFELPVGQVSNVFETENGFAVVRVTKREPAGRTPVAEVQDQIRQALLNQAQERNAEVVLSDLRDKAVITKYLD